LSRALEGIRVLDLADRSAALAGRILADLGAEVILVEPPEGLSIRRLAPFLGDKEGTERSLHHQYLSANKKSVVAEDASRFVESDAFRSLVASADLLIDTARPGQRTGLDHEALARIQPRLIQISVTPFGLGDLDGRKANDLVAGAAGGLIAVSGERLGTPVQGGAHPSYCMASIAAASAATIALTQRDAAADLGSIHIDVSLQEATTMAVMQTANPTKWTWHGQVPKRPGLSAALRCKDGGHVGLLVRPDRFPDFLAWCERVGVEHGMTPEDWPWARLDAPRKGNPVSEAILALARALTRDEFAEGALEADIVCLPVFDFEDISRHEQFVANDAFCEIEQPTLGGPLGFVRSPVDGMGDGVEIRPAPRLGQDTQAIRDEFDASANAHAPRRAAATASDRRPADPAKALEGLLVVDFGWVLAAPIGSRLLASFGAEVIRVESSRKPDSMRSQLGPDGKPDPDLGGLYNTVNTGKKSLSVDLTQKGGLELVKALIARADIVVNNFRPGALDRMGLGYSTLREIKPDILLLNLPGAHPKGPWAGRASMGNILMAASGFNMLTGFEGEQPRGIGVAYPDFVSPHLMVASLLAGLRHRNRTGQGQEIEAVQLSSTLSLLGVEWMQYRATGRQPPRGANRSPNHAPHGIYPTAGEDEWMAIAVENDDDWQVLSQLITGSALGVDERFLSHERRKENEDALDEILREWTAPQDKWEASARLQAAGIAAAPVEDLRDTFERDPILREHYQILHQPIAPEVEIPVDREVARWVGFDQPLSRAPGLGEHNEYVVKELLGWSEEKYVELLTSGVLD
jgi:crotonobetainyl-CoA:carnitine CoA-transferase CaiB-like acyl-CoA transferase